MVERRCRAASVGSWKNGERENEFVFPEVNQQHTLKQGVGAGNVTGRTFSLQRHGKSIQIQFPSSILSGPFSRKKASKISRKTEES